MLLWNEFRLEARRLVACTQAVIILRGTSYNAIELQCSAFEVVRNSIEWVKIVISAYERFSLFSLTFAVVCLFVFSFLKQERHFEFQSYGGAWHRLIELPFVQNNSRNISGLGKLTDLKIREVQSLLISYNITISWLNPLNGFRIIFLLLQDCVTVQSKSCFAGVNSYISFFHLKCTIIR